jgi:hypothetical protein
MRKNNIKLGRAWVLSILNRKGKIYLSQIEKIPFINDDEVKLIYNELLSNSNFFITKEKISSSPYLEFDKVVSISAD